MVAGYYTFGEYEVVIIIEAPNDEIVMSLMLKVGSAGNVRTKTLKAFAAEEAMKIINLVLRWQMICSVLFDSLLGLFSLVLHIHTNAGL